MDRPIFEKLREIVYQNSGIALNDTKEAMVSARIAKRMRALGLTTHQQYLNYLLNETGGHEIILFLDVISTNVTSFFRESAHFEFLQSTVSKWISRGKKRIRIWSAAASTGEEPYSIAMTLIAAAGESPLDVRILATDISTAVLKKAQEGIYTSSSADGIPESFRKRFFICKKHDEELYYHASDALKKIIVFRRLNLSKPPFPMSGQLDMVFCRNVMIYFDNDVRSRLVNEIYRLLNDSGYMITGHAESLTSVRTDFKCLGPSIYQKL